MFVLLRFIASIFYQILYMSILASVIGLIILLIQKIINRRISPQFKYFIWFSFVIMLIFPISACTDDVAVRALITCLSYGDPVTERR